MAENSFVLNFIKTLSFFETIQEIFPKLLNKLQTQQQGIEQRAGNHKIVLFTSLSSFIFREEFVSSCIGSSVNVGPIKLSIDCLIKGFIYSSSIELLLQDIIFISFYKVLGLSVFDLPKDSKGPPKAINNGSVSKSFC